ncbi:MULTISPECIES: sulfurtransferase complex subunit TusB [Pseudomonas]|nr:MULTISPECIES: sulfurtransferase complex subunit TusB [Pseudomonas]
MKTLHLISASPFQSRMLDSALPLLAEQDALLLMGDATYLLQESSRTAALLETLQTGVKGFALQEDIEARGLRETSRFEMIDYDRFVALCVAYDKVHSWP